MHEQDIKEQEIIKELRQVTGKRMLQVTDMLEYSDFQPEEPVEGVLVFYLPVLKLYVSVEEK